MKNKVKRSLFTSILSLLLCLSMAIGTTFAWFSETIESGDNNIVVGNLDIDIDYSKNMEDWNDVAGAQNLFSDVTNWEPGAASVVYLKISNEGLLDVKYNLGITVKSEISGTNVNGETFKLSDYIQFGQVEDVTEKYETRDAAIEAVSGKTAIISSGYTLTGSMKSAKSKTIALVVYMPETVGNEANFKKDTTQPKITMGVKLVATQLSSEEDGFGDDYDSETPWLGGYDDAGLEENTDTENKTVKIYTAEQLASFAKSAAVGGIYENYTITLENDIDLNNFAWTPINGTNQKMIFDGNDHTIKNLLVSGTKSVGLFGSVVIGEVKNINIENANVTGIAYVGAVVGSAYCKVSNCSVKNATIIANGEWDKTQYVDGAKAGAVVGLLREEEADQIISCSATNVTIKGYRDLGGIVGCIYNKNTVTGNTISNVTINQGDWSNYEDGDYTTLGAIYGRIVDGSGTDSIQENTGDATINSVSIVKVKAAETAAETTTNVKNAINNAEKGTNIVLPETDQVIDLTNSDISKDGVTIVGNDETKLKVSTGGDSPSVNADGVVFESVVFDYGNQTYNAIRGKVTYKNCTFNGLVNSYDNSTFINCTFTNSKYLAHVYGGSATFTGCTFNGTDRCVYVYTEGGDASATFTDCTFTMSSETPDKSAVMLNNDDHGGSSVLTVTLTNCTQKGGNDLGTESADGESYNYQGLWGTKLSPKGTVTVDGTVVYQNPAN